MQRSILFIFLTFSLFFYSCSPDSSEQQENNADSIIEAPVDTFQKDTVLQVRAKFIKYEMGDASHFTFEDEKGNIWDFGGSEDKDHEFAIEIQEEKQNEQNQGWTSNPDLKGKWFNLKYIYRLQPQYQDGPISRVPVIMEAELIGK